MRALRAATRLAMFAFVTTTVSALRLLSLLALRPWPGADRKMRARLFKVWAHTMGRVIGLRVEVRGPVPTRPFLLVTNHLSYIDVLTLAGVLDAVFVAKADVGRWPMLGPMVKVFDTIFIDRRNAKSIVQANCSIEAKLREGEGLVLFAEGTSSQGEEVLPLKSSLLDVAARGSHPVHYASLSYHTPEGESSARTAVCWWGDMAFLPHFFNLLKLPGFSVTITFGSGTVTGNDRKVLAEQLKDLIHQQHIPVPE